MLSIQDAGTEILSGNPRSVYVFGGTEYGIKQKYISILTKHYEGRTIESPDAIGLVQFLHKKHIVPLQPSLYIVRYDDVFISKLSEALANQLISAKGFGTIILLYESDKQVAKCEKYLPSATVRIDSVSPQFVFKYLRSDFPQLPDQYINLAIECSSNYSQAKLICNAMSSISISELSKMKPLEIAKLFGKSDGSSESALKLAVANRQFNQCISIMENYTFQPLDNLIYTMLQTMIDLDKVLDSKYSQSELKQSAKFWTREDVYYMFMHCYAQLELLRSSSGYECKDGLVYLFGLLKFQRIPSLEVMKWN